MQTHKPVNRFDEDGNEISPEELAAEIARLNAKPEHQNFLKTGLRSGTDSVVDGVAILRSRAGNEFGQIPMPIYERLMARLGVEAAYEVVCAESRYNPDWQVYLERLEISAH